MSNLSDGFINDDLAKLHEPYEPPYQFLYTGRKPQVGQRTESQVNVGGKMICRFEGIVTDVSELPSYSEWAHGDSHLVPNICLKCNPHIDPEQFLQPNVKFGRHDARCSCLACDLIQGNTEITLPVLMDRCLETMGTIHNQTITTYAYFILETHLELMVRPFHKGRIYKIQYKANDRKRCFWCITSIEDVTDTMKVSELPQVFRDWETGRENAGVAPYDLVSESERNKWHEEAKRKDANEMMPSY